MAPAALLMHLAAAATVSDRSEPIRLKASGAPAIESVSPSTFAVEGMSSGECATVVGSGFEQSATAVCRVSSPPGKQSTTFRYGGGGYPEPAGLSIYFPAQVENSTLLRCVPPPVVVGGAGLLSATMDNISFSNALPIRYANLLDVAIGRRPYLTEAHGSLLLMPSPRLQGLHLNVVAELPCANWSTSWTVDVPTLYNGYATYTWIFTYKCYIQTLHMHHMEQVVNASIVLNFPFTRLPHDIDNDLRVAAYGIPWRKDPLVIWRRLMRHVPGPAVAPGSTQVDHHIRALRVGGQPFVGQGWYVYGGFAWAQQNISMLFAPVKRQAELGIDLIMPYNLNDFNITDQQRYLDWCHAVGVKVLYPMVYFAGATNQYNYGSDWDSPQWLAAVRANVSQVKSHPGQYYILTALHLHNRPAQ
eukprot:COSAG03_NODE_623_length_6665_cov_3.515230_5_plen_416_part_00